MFIGLEIIETWFWERPDSNPDTEYFTHDDDSRGSKAFIRVCECKSVCLCVSVCVCLSAR